MIQEDYVSFEVAKLLKEKGFDEKCLYYYEDNRHCGENIKFSNWYNNEYSNSNIGRRFAAPTQAMAMRWLREIHNTAINIGWGEILEDKFQWWCIILNLKDGSVLRESEYYATYEGACEAAIKYCLENLI